ncbi:MAG: hypothetical protein WBQ43_13930 [Terriglobales bacterium]
MSTAILPNSAVVPVAPIPRWSEAGQHAHAVQFYSDGTFFLDELSRFIGTALLAGEAAVVIATDAHRDGIVQRLTHFQATGAGMGVGLAGIRERAWELGGRLQVSSNGNGTLVQLILPMAQTAPE